MIMPAICAYSRNLSLGFLLVTISTSVNNTWPPSSAGIGRRFMKARAMDRKPVKDQNASQFQVGLNALAILINPPTCFTLNFREKINAGAWYSLPGLINTPAQTKRVALKGHDFLDSKIYRGYAFHRASHRKEVFLSWFVARDHGTVSKISFLFDWYLSPSS